MDPDPSFDTDPNPINDVPTSERLGIRKADVIGAYRPVDDVPLEEDRFDRALGGNLVLNVAQILHFVIQSRVLKNPD